MSASTGSGPPGVHASNQFLRHLGGILLCVDGNALNRGGVEDHETGLFLAAGALIALAGAPLKADSRHASSAGAAMLDSAPPTSTVCSGPLSHERPHLFDGSYIPWETGALRDDASIPEANFNPYRRAANSLFSGKIQQWQCRCSGDRGSKRLAGFAGRSRLRSFKPGRRGCAGHRASTATLASSSTAAR